MGLNLFLFCACSAFLMLVIVVVCHASMGGNKRPEPSHTPVPPKPKSVSRIRFQRFTVKSVIRWEQMRGKSFSLVDYTDKEDVESLLYALYVTSDKYEYTFDVFRQVLADERFMNAMLSELGKVMEIVSQFQRKVATSDIGNSESSPDYVGAIVSALIMSGLDAHYALNEMELCDLPLFIEAYERKKKEQMEESRMWTYLTILPHIDAKKMENGAKDLITFPWEEKEDVTEISDIEAQRFEEFMKKGKDFLKS